VQLIEEEEEEEEEEVTLFLNCTTCLEDLVLPDSTILYQ